MVAQVKRQVEIDLEVDNDTLAELSGGEYAVQPEHPILTGGSVRVNKAVISIVAGCFFLLTALAALFISLSCVWGGVFQGTKPENAIAGFFGGVLISLIAGNFGWRFIAKA
jgi:hypothetical protein